MAVTVSNNSRELFFRIAEKEFHKYPHWYQDQERKQVISMLEEYGLKKESEQLKKLM